MCSFNLKDKFLLFGLRNLPLDRRWFGCDALFGDDVVSFGFMYVDNDGCKH
jgi:hypothetical protein